MAAPTYTGQLTKSWRFCCFHRFKFSLFDSRTSTSQCQLRNSSSHTTSGQSPPKFSDVNHWLVTSWIHLVIAVLWNLTNSTAQHNMKQWNCETSMWNDTRLPTSWAVGVLEHPNLAHGGQGALAPAPAARARNSGTSKWQIINANMLPLWILCLCHGFCVFFHSP